MEADAEVIGPDRSKLINEFVDMIRRDPIAWRDARRVATARGETIVGVVLKALRSYVARNRELLMPPPTETRPPEQAAPELPSS